MKGTTKEIICRRYSTKDYDLFEELPENRDASKMRPHQKRIGESMQRHGFMYFRPLLVVKGDNGKLKIIDGQNRFREAKKQDIEVVYEILDEVSNKLLIDLQAAKDWRAEDYVHNYVTTGESESMTYLNWLQGLYPKMGHPVIACLLEGDMTSGSGQGVLSIREGKIKINHKETTEATLAFLNTMYNSPLPERIKREIWKRPFAKAVYILKRNGDFDDRRLLDKMTAHHNRILLQNSMFNWFVHLEELYNLHSRTPVKFVTRPIK